MQSFSRGWSFSLSRRGGWLSKIRIRFKPSVYALVVGMIISVIGIIPIIIVAVLTGDSQIGRIIMGVLSAVLMFIQFTVTYVFSAMTIRLIYGYLTTGDGRMDEAGHCAP